MADPPPDAADTPDSVIDLTGDQSQDPSPPDAQGQPGRPYHTTTHPMGVPGPDGSIPDVVRANNVNLPAGES